MKILIIRFSSIGDIVLTTPIIRCLKQQLNAEIHYLTKPDFAIILNSNPYIDKLHLLDKSLIAKAKELQPENFDCVIDLHNNLRTHIFKTTMGIKAFAFPKLNFKKWLLVNFKINKMPSIHIVERYFTPAQSLGVNNDGKGLDYFLPKDFSFNYQIDLNKSFIAWGIGAQHFTKRFPIHKIIAICNKLNLPMYIIGGKEDEANGNEIAKQTNHQVVNLCGKLSLNQSAYVIKNCTLLITNDTGLMHIGAAYQKPIISLWGNTTPLLGMSPYYGNSNVKQALFENNHLTCRPCSKIGFQSCPKKHFKCMEDLDIQSIEEQIMVMMRN